MNSTENIIDDFKYHKENISLDFLFDLFHYNEIFVQRNPRYGIKQLNGKPWRSKPGPLTDIPVLSHLYGKYFVGCVARWYPGYGIFDIDSRIKEYVVEIREKAGMNDNNSHLYHSESTDSWHLLFKLSYNDKPPTTNLYQKCVKPFIRENHIEAYPQPRRIIRLPFGPHQKIVDVYLHRFRTWQNKLYWFDQLEEYDISRFPGQQLTLDLEYKTPFKFSGTLQEGSELFDHGLDHPESRHDSQFLVLCYLARNNIQQYQAEEMTWKWINEKHNGHSKEITSCPEEVRNSIKRQAKCIYEKSYLSNTYPDSTHNNYDGYLCEPDMREILMINSGNTPRSKFLFHLLKYSYPRHQRSYIGIPRANLINWSSTETYLPNIDYFESKGVLERGSAYCQGKFSKNIKLKWKYRGSDEAILYDGRSVDTFDDTVRLLYKPREFREILINAGASKDGVYHNLKRVYGNDHIQVSL